MTAAATVRAAMVLGVALIATAASADERTFNVGSFDRVKASGSTDVSIVSGPALSVRATGSTAALDRLEVVVDDGKLRVGTRSGWHGGWQNDSLKVIVTMPLLRGIEVSGSAEVRAAEAAADAFSAAVSGSGEVKVAKLTAPKVSVAVGGSGSVTLAGNCDTASVQIGGSGDVKMADLKCRVISASIGGSGDLDAYASEQSSVSVSGSGDARIRGGGKCRFSTSGSADATCG